MLLSYNPWDSGTRVHETPSIPDSYRMVELIKAVGADGVNGDTMDGMPEEWWRAAEKLDYPVMLQPELGFGAFDWLHNITYNTMSWAYLPYTGTISDDVAWEGIADLPLVSKYSFLVSAHQAQICERWARQHVNGKHFVKDFVNCEDEAVFSYRKFSFAYCKSEIIHFSLCLNLFILCRFAACVFSLVVDLCHGRMCGASLTM